MPDRQQPAGQVPDLERPAGGRLVGRDDLDRGQSLGPTELDDLGRVGHDSQMGAQCGDVLDGPVAVRSLAAPGDQGRPSAGVELRRAEPRLLELLRAHDHWAHRRRPQRRDRVRLAAQHTQDHRIAAPHPWKHGPSAPQEQRTARLPASEVRPVQGA